MAVGASTTTIAIFDGESWIALDGDQPYLPLTGGTLTGKLFANAGVEVKGGFTSISASAERKISHDSYGLNLVKTSLYIEDGSITASGSDFRFYKERKNGVVPYEPIYPESLVTRVYADKFLRRDASNGVDAAGIVFTGTSIVGSPNRIGFRWGSPYIYGAVDNVVYGIVGEMSSARFKAGVAGVSSALDTVSRLRAVEYTPMDLDGSLRLESGRHLGLIAEEVAQVLPDSVMRGPDGTVHSLAYSEITSLLVAAVQELQERVRTLEAAAAPSG